MQFKLINEKFDSDKFDKEILSDRDDYKNMGFKDREDFLKTMADDYGIPIEKVRAEADKIGKENELYELEDVLRNL